MIYALAWLGAIIALLIFMVGAAVVIKALSAKPPSDD